MKKYFCMAFILIVSALGLIGCGVSTLTQVRMDWKPYDKNEFKQEKEGLIVELKDTKKLPESFFADVQAYNEYGQALVNSEGRPTLEKVCLSFSGQWWDQVAITNQTDHVIRLNSIVIRLFDPAGNQDEPLSKDDLISYFLSNRPYPSSYQAVERFKLIKLIDRNLEILPNSTITGWLAFKPASMEIPGIWKLAIYEVPVKFNEAGQVTKTTRFEIRIKGKKFIDTYEEEFMGKRRKVDSQEVTD